MKHINKILAALIVLVFAFGMISDGKTQELPQNDIKLGSQSIPEHMRAESYEQVFSHIRSGGRTYDDGFYFITDEVEFAEDAVSFVTEPSASFRDEANSAVKEYASGEEYSGTNVQVEGIDESDIVKTDGKYIYTSDGVYIKIIEASGKDTKLVTELKVGSEYDEKDNSHITGMYISENVLVAILNKYSYDLVPGSYMMANNETVVKLYDLSDISSPKLITEYGQDGSISDSRLKDGVLYIVSAYYVVNAVSDAPESYIPCIRCYDDIKTIPLDCIILPIDEKLSESWTVISSVDIKTGELISNQSVLGTCETLYMSESSIYLADNTYRSESSDAVVEGPYKITHHKDIRETKIMRFGISDGKVEYAAAGTVPGIPINQFALDEYEGYLRIVTTDMSNSFSMYVDEENGWTNYKFDDAVTTSGLYILNKDLEVTGSITELAKDEQVYSVRFDGDIGYFVTFKQVDPLFSADLSDPENPKILGELKIPGFSTYLHPYGDGLLFGIGNHVEDEENARIEGIKLSMFDVSDPSNVYEKTKLILDNSYSEALYNHKAILVLPAKNIIGFMTEKTYRIFSCEDGEFREKAAVEFDDWYYDARGMWIGDYIYIVSAKGINVISLDSFEIVRFVNI